jgi:hypothetical protein
VSLRREAQRGRLALAPAAPHNPGMAADLSDDDKAILAKLGPEASAEEKLKQIAKAKPSPMPKAKE